MQARVLLFKNLRQHFVESDYDYKRFTVETQGKDVPAAKAVALNEAPMFERRLSIVKVDATGERESCPVRWIDNFAMRNFTNEAVFDDTLPVGDGLLEAGHRVPLDRLGPAMEDWFRRKGYLKGEERLEVVELAQGGPRWHAEKCAEQTSKSWRLKAKMTVSKRLNIKVSTGPTKSWLSFPGGCPGPWNLFTDV